VRLDSKAVTGGYEVRIVAIPTRDVPTIELSLAGKRVSFGATAAGQRRELTTVVIVRPSEGADIIGSARTAGRNRAEVLRVGAAKQRAVKRVNTVTLPDGRQIGEVR
jgi:hypothetical protein